MFTRVQVIAKRQESQTIWSFYLKPTNGTPVAHYQPGQHIIVRLDIPGQAGPIQRSYTLSTAPGQDHYRITVKREGTSSQPGLASSFLHDHVQPGDTLWISEPRGALVLPKGSRRPVVLLSAGVGITPMLSMLETIAKEPDPRRVWFVHGSRNANEQPMGDLLRSLAHAHEHIRLSIHHSQPSENEILGQDYDVAGWIDLDFLKRYLPDTDADFYLCGPVSFVIMLTDFLKSWGVRDSQLSYAYFSKAESTNLSEPQIDQIITEEDSDPSGPRVSLTKSGRSLAWRDCYGSLLVLLEQQGIFPPSSCREGTCLSCSTSMLSGAVSYEPEPFGEPFEGEILLCCTRPKTNIELDL